MEVVNTHIVPLTCPQCGNTKNVSERQLHYGFEFACESCSTVSVLVIDNRLYVPRPGEHVCSECGYVVEPEARFCANCGGRLPTRYCPACQVLVSSDAKFCTNCGVDIDRYWQKLVRESEARARQRIVARRQYKKDLKKALRDARFLILFALLVVLIVVGVLVLSVLLALA
jgi:RNA polymerase subunit RPABC4/transcription elongation factor Spt4